MLAVIPVSDVLGNTNRELSYVLQECLQNAQQDKIWQLCLNSTVHGTGENETSFSFHVFREFIKSVGS